MDTQQTLHLHMISDSAGDSLTEIASAVRSQHTHVRTVEHVHAGVRWSYRLQKALNEVRAERGIVLYSLSNPEHARMLKQACAEINVPCLTAQPQAAPPQAKPSLKLRAVVVFLLGIFLTWEITTRGLAAYLAEANPDSALLLSRSNAAALVNLAQGTLAARGDGNDTDAGETGQDGAAAGGDRKEDADGAIGSERNQSEAPKNPELEAWLEKALRADPLNAKAFLLLGQTKYTAEDQEPTNRLMQAAARRSLHHSNATYWVIRNGHEDGNYRKAVYYADVLLRDRPQVVNEVMPILGRIAEEPDGRDQLTQVLATNPPWRTTFFDLLPRYIKDARTPLNVALGLQNSRHPLKQEELTNYLAFLVDKGFEDLAYYVWLQFLPGEELAKVGRLMNGNFEREPSGLMFDWLIKDGPNVTIERVERLGQEQDHALRLDFGAGRVKELSVSQLVMLPPGSYRFEGEYLSESKSTRGLKWRISCRQDRIEPLGESAPVVKLSEGEWRQFGFSFMVPDEKCTAQRIELLFDARWASERFISGSIWYDNLDIKLIEFASQ